MISDPENPEWTEADFAAAKGPEAMPPALAAAFLMTSARRGRPPGSSAETTKQQVTLRIDRDIIGKFKATGPGWQSRINDALRRAIG